MIAHSPPEHHKRGGAPVGVLTKMDPWEADLILDLRLYCQGPDGQAHVWNSFATTLPRETAQDAMQAFETLIGIITSYAHRPLVRHDVCCSCVGADEGVFAHLVSTASAGHLTDAALIASLMVTATHAERVALLAGQVGETARLMAKGRATDNHTSTTNIVQLH